MEESDHSQARIEDREDVLRLLQSDDIALPDRLTVEKIRERGAWWRVSDESVSFRLERHPSPFVSASLTGGPSPARWHIRIRYRYDLTTGEWEVTELSREFSFNETLLIDHVFERGATRDHWHDAMGRIQEADDPETTFEEEFDQFVELYREQWREIPTDQRNEMLAVLKRAARRRADLPAVEDDFE